MTIWIPIGLIVLGILSVIIEVFIPAAGVLGILGILLIILSTVFSYIYHGTILGTIFLLIAMIGTPVAVLISFKFFPKTFFGKKLIHNFSEQQAEGFVSHDDQDLAALTGQEGLALTILRPSGLALINNKKYNVVTTGDFIEKDSPVKVLKINGSHIIVKKI